MKNEDGTQIIEKKKIVRQLRLNRDLSKNITMSFLWKTVKIAEFRESWVMVTILIPNVFSDNWRPKTSYGASLRDQTIDVDVWVLKYPWSCFRGLKRYYQNCLSFSVNHEKWSNFGITSYLSNEIRAKIVH